MKKTPIISIVLLTILLTITFAIEAQPGGGGGQGQGGPPPGSGSVPIDGGAILLAIGAAIYGRRQMKATTTE